MGCTMTTPREKHDAPSPKRSYCSTIDTIDYLKSVSNIAPVNYRFKVESYSKLCEALETHGIDHFESSPFNAGGYQWMLSVYPNGKKSENKEGHISTYIKLVDKVTGDKMIHATMKIFIYDHLHEQYLTVQDTRLRTFDALKAEWGIPQLMDVTTFKDPANGFLFNDGCLFGVEILVQCENKIRTSLAPVLLGTDNSYAWKVDNFLKLEEDSISSPIFSLGGYKWKLIMYPRGLEESKGKSLSLFFGPADTFDGKLFVELSMKDLKYKGNQTASTWFSDPDIVFGFPNFVPLSGLTDPRYTAPNVVIFGPSPSPYKQGDPITIEFKIHVMFLLKDL